MYLFLLVIGFALVGASAFTTTYYRWWGERGGMVATFVLRNLLGIPLWVVGAVLAWTEPSPHLFSPGLASNLLGWMLVGAGSIPFIWGHVTLGMPTHSPSVHDTLEREGLYAHVRHPIYAGGLLIVVGLAFLRPTVAFLAGCALGLVWLYVQARLEEMDLAQRIPAYREYMKDIPRFVPRLRRKVLT